jgi:Tfp pilus assembly protein PilF
LHSERDIGAEAELAQRQGKHAVAVELFRRALQDNFGRVDWHGNMGISLAALGRLDEAAAAYQTAISLKPDLPQAYNNLAGIYQSQGKYELALDNMRQAISWQPGNAETHYNLGNLLCEMDRREEGIAAYQEALAIRPDLAPAWNNMGGALREMGRFTESVAACRQALALNPSLTDAMNNLSNALSAQGLLAEAKHWLEKVLSLRPDDALAHLNSSLLRLLQGDLPGAWSEYEWRWQVPKLKSWRPQFTQPQWDGGDLNGRRIFLYAEQGFGDAIQFIRYAALVAQQGGEVILACQTELLELMAGAPGVSHCIPRGQVPLLFDVHCPLMSLANVFQSTLQTIPAEVPYLQANPQKAARWRQRLAKLPGRKIGVAWCGRQYPDPRRSMRLIELAELLAMKDVNWISLQKGPIPGEARIPPPGVEIVDWSEELTDFSETAALIDGLDEVITIDSAVAHLAGAMGKPTSLLVPLVADWRWMLDRSDSPWYPTMRLYRQQKLGDWQNPVKLLAASLKTHLG